MKYHIKATRDIDGFRAELVGKNSLTIHDFTIDCDSKEQACAIMTGIVLSTIEEDVSRLWRTVYKSFFYFMDHDFVHEDLRFSIREVK
jgi:hypothetical protein